MGKSMKFYITGFVVLILVVSIFTFLPFSSNRKTQDDPKEDMPIIAEELPLSVTIDIEPMSTIYEGDIITCTITGDPHIIYWYIDDNDPHDTFYNNNIWIFDPEPTPLDKEFVELTVYVEDDEGHATDNITVKIKRIFYGDIHFHSRFSDGKYSADRLFKNAIEDKYLDFVCLTDHAEILDSFDLTSPNKIRDVLQIFINKLFRRTEWGMIKDKAIKYYEPGRFTTLLGFEYSAGPYHPGGKEDTEYGAEDVGHINFYYRDIYPDAGYYSASDYHTFNDIFEVMAEEWDKGHMNLGFPHHPVVFNGHEINTVNWTWFADHMENEENRDKILRGVETYSCWGTAIGRFSGIPISWPYPDDRRSGQNDAWVENAMWEWSEDDQKYAKFAMMASSDIHFQDRPGSGRPNANTIFNSFIPEENPAGLVAVYAVHNTREEIWDALYNCDMYANQLLKIRANVRVNDELNYGGWVNTTGPVNINVSVHSTFRGEDRSGMNMCPHAYEDTELDYPIGDIWIIKKDTDTGRPWCKIVSHTHSYTDQVFVNFTDEDVQPNDFYYVAIRQQGRDLKVGDGEAYKSYMSFIGPIFIDQVN